MSKIVLPASAKVLIDFEGQEYSISKPNLGIQSELEEELASAKSEGKSTTKIILNYIVRCGLPEEVTKKLDLSQLEALMEFITPKKKAE